MWTIAPGASAVAKRGAKAHAVPIDRVHRLAPFGFIASRFPIVVNSKLWRDWAPVNPPPRLLMNA